jgi:hypothetical protein
VSSFKTKLEGRKEHFITGLKWKVFSTPQEKNSSIKREGYKNPKICSIDNQLNSKQVGMCDSKEIPSGKSYSVAALYSIFQDLSDLDGESVWIALEEFETGFWVAFVSNGEIVFDTNSDLSIDEASNKIMEYAELAGDSGANPSIIGGASQAFDNNKSDITLERIFSELSKRDLKRAVVRNVSTKEVWVLFFFCALIIAFTLYKVVLPIIFPESSKEVIEHKKKVKKATKKVAQYYDDIYRLPTIKDSINSFYKKIDSKGLLNSPWQLGTINCDLSRSVCQASYLNEEKLKTNYITSYLSSRCDSLNITIQGTTANCAFNLPPTEKRSKVVGENPLSLTNNLMKYVKTGIKIQIEDAKQSKISRTALAPKKLLMKEGAWSMSGDILVIFNVANILDQIEWAKVKKITLTVAKNSSVNVKLEGIYVIK